MIKHKYRFLHSGCAGDIIYSLPIVKYHSSGELYLALADRPHYKYDGTLNGLYPELVQGLIPLLEAQPYISKAAVWTDEYCLRLDKWYDHYWGRRGDRNLCEYVLDFYRIPRTIIDAPWLTAESKKIAPTVIHRSGRYRDEKIVPQLKQLTGDAVFVGFEEEWKVFCREVGEIPFYPVKDFYEMACVINGAETFVGNQSAPMAIAIALGKNYTQESYPPLADCIFKNKGTYLK